MEIIKRDYTVLVLSESFLSVTASHKLDSESPFLQSDDYFQRQGLLSFSAEALGEAQEDIKRKRDRVFWNLKRFLQEMVRFRVFNFQDRRQNRQHSNFIRNFRPKFDANGFLHIRISQVRVRRKFRKEPEPIQHDLILSRSRFESSRNFNHTSADRTSQFLVRISLWTTIVRPPLILEFHLLTGSRR